MKRLEIPFLPGLENDAPLVNIASLLNQLPKNQIDNLPWPAYTYKPDVAFAAAHNNISFLVKFFVKEQTAQARFRHTHDPVYKDSCVEVFIKFRQKEYYNMEFNLLGTCRAGFGPDRNNRLLLPEKIIQKIKRWPSRQKIWLPAGTAVTAWELTLIIPVEVFCFNQLSSFTNIKANANFFKCGDDLPEPHFLAWNNIIAPEPDFHLPAYFGTIQFV